MMGMAGCFAWIDVQIRDPVVRMDAPSTTITSGLNLSNIWRASFPVVTKVTLYPFASKSGTKDGISALLLPAQRIRVFRVELFAMKVNLQK